MNEYINHDDTTYCNRRMYLKGRRTLSLDDGSVLYLRVFVCDCDAVHFELDKTKQALPPYME